MGATSELSTAEWRCTIRIADKGVLVEPEILDNGVNVHSYCYSRLVCKKSEQFVKRGGKVLAILSEREQVATFFLESFSHPFGIT